MALLLITLLGAALRFYHLGRQGFWYDESYTIALLKLPPGRMLGLLPHEESTPPLYYCVAWIWSRIFGLGQAGVRSLSAFCGTLVIPVAYATARKLLDGRRFALIAAALTAFNPMLIWYSQEARSYELLVLTSACSLLTFAYARERPRPLALALWAVACALALCTHYYTILVVVPEAAWLVYEHRYRRGVYAAIGFIAVVGAGLLPLLLSQSQTGNNDWIGRAPLGERLSQVIPLFLLGPETPARVVLKFLAFALVLGALALLVFRSRRRERQGALLPAGIGLSGLILSLLLVPVDDTLLARNLLAVWLPLALVVAAGLGVARMRVLGTVLTAALCGIGATATIGVARDYWLGRPDWQPVAQLLGPPPAHGRRVIVVVHNPSELPLALYLSGLRHIQTGSVTDVTQVDLIAVKDIPDLGGFCWWGSACNLSPGDIPRHVRFGSFHRVLHRRVEQFVVLKLVSDEPATITRDSIKRALRTARLTADALLVQP